MNLICVIYQLLLYISFCSPLYSNTYLREVTNLMDLSQTKIGFLGCGKISSAVCRGFATASGTAKPKQIFVSRRSEAKSAALQAEFPDLVNVCASNEELVAACDIVFLGLLPDVAREILPQLPFDASKMVLSMMAAVDYAEVVSLLKMPTEKVSKIVPLPGAARRQGPILMHPQSAQAESLLSIVGTPVVCASEPEMKPLIAITGHISSFLQLMKVTNDFATSQGTANV